MHGEACNVLLQLLHFGLIHHQRSDAHRPELEHELESSIPHYRKRHWMRPGLSGWAQVCAPYASSIDDSDLKLSYDLYYLRHFSTWLDLVILFRTIKTVLKAGGR